MNDGKKKISVGIDGPAGSGKSTIAKLVSKKFGLAYVDTGAMYRGVGLLALESGVAPDNEKDLAEIASAAEFDFRMDDSSGDMFNRVFLNGQEVTGKIRTPEVSDMASRVSAVSGVRRALVVLQKKMGRDGGVVMEGRDICNVVMPEAEVKIFLTASPEERATRRHLEMKQSGVEACFEDVLNDIRERDTRDSTRADSPLKPAPDSVHVNTDNLTIDQVVEKISGIISEKTGESPVRA